MRCCWEVARPAMSSRHGADKAVVSCVFESTAGAEAILEANGIDLEGHEILLRREVNASGKGRVFLNNQPATVSVLRQLAPNWHWYTRRPRPWAALISRSSAGCSIASQASIRRRFSGANLRWTCGNVCVPVKTSILRRREKTSARRMRFGASPGRNLIDWAARSRSDCVWPTCGASSATRFAMPTFSTRKKTKRSRLRSAFWRTPEKLYTAAMSAHESLYEGEGSAETTLAAAQKQVEEFGPL